VVAALPPNVQQIGLRLQVSGFQRRTSARPIYNRPQVGNLPHMWLRGGQYCAWATIERGLQREGKNAGVDAGMAGRRPAPPKDGDSAGGVARRQRLAHNPHKGDAPACGKSY